jgi:thiol-disulfide isomerase/thioredoxin
MKYLKIGALAIMIAAGSVIMVLVFVSYFFADSGNRVPDIEEIETSELIFRGSQGVFLDKSLEVRPDIISPGLGFSAPDIELIDFEGNPVKLSDLRGKPVLLNFWATWCPPCRVEMPALQSFHQDYGDQIQILGINWNDESEKARDLLAQFDISFQNIIDIDGKAFVTYRLTAVPTSFWIDEDGVIRGVWNGAMTEETLIDGFRITTNALDEVGTLSDD